MGKICVYLGAGRLRKEDKIDNSVGVVLEKKIGDKVNKKDTLAYIHANDEIKAKEAVQRLKNVYKIQ